MVASPQINNAEIAKFSLPTSMRIGLYLWHMCLCTGTNVCYLQRLSICIVTDSFIYRIHAL